MVGQGGTATDKYLTSERWRRQKLGFLAIISGGNIEPGKTRDIHAEIAHFKGGELRERPDQTQDSKREKGEKGGHVLTIDQLNDFFVMKSIHNKPCRKDRHLGYSLFRSVFSNPCPAVTRRNGAVLLLVFFNTILQCFKHGSSMGWIRNDTRKEVGFGSEVKNEVHYEFMLGVAEICRIAVIPFQSFGVCHYLTLFRVRHYSFVIFSSCFLRHSFSPCEPGIRAPRINTSQCAAEPPYLPLIGQV